MAKKQNILPDLDIDNVQLPELDLPDLDIKKKVGVEQSESSEEPTTTVEKIEPPKFEDWEVEMFKGFDENPKSLETASQLDINKYNEWKKQQKANLPVLFLAEDNSINKKSELLKKHYPESKEYLDQLPVVTPENIGEVSEEFRKIEQMFDRSIVNPMTGQSVSTQYGLEKKGVDDNLTAIRKLEEDVERLKKAATGADVSIEGEVLAASPLPGSGLIGGVVEAAQAVAKGKTKELVKGVGSGVKTYVEGYTKLNEELKSNRAVTELQKKNEKLEQGEDVEWTEEDILLAKALVENMKAHKELDKEIPSAYKIGESIGQSMGFMLEFGALSGAGKAATAPLAAVKAGSSVGRAGLGVAIKLLDTGIQTAAMPSFYKGIAEKTSRGMGFGEALLDSYWETGSEVLTEKLFLQNPASKGVASATGKIMERLGINFAADKGVAGTVKNILEENVEEKINQIFVAPKDYEGFGAFWKDFTDKEQNKILFGSVSLMTGVMSGGALALSPKSKANYKRKIAKLEKILPSDLRAEIDGIVNNKELSAKDMYDLVGDVISERIDRQELSDDPATVTGNAMDYATSMIQNIAAENVEEAQPPTEKKDGEVVEKEEKVSQKEDKSATETKIKEEKENEKRVQQESDKKSTETVKQETESGTETGEAEQEAGAEEKVGQEVGQDVQVEEAKQPPQAQNKPVETPKQEKGVEVPPKQETSPETLKKRRVNTIIDKIRTHNEMPKSYTAKRGVLSNEITKNANELGYKVKVVNGKIKLLNEQGREVAKKFPEQTPKEVVAKHKGLNEYEDKKFVDFVEDVVSDENNLTDLDIGIKPSRVNQAIRDVKAGKKSVAANTLLDALEQGYTQGEFYFKKKDGLPNAVGVKEMRESMIVSEERKRQKESDAIDADLEEKAKADLSDVQKRAIRETKKEENKQRLASIFDDIATLTGAKKGIVEDERREIRRRIVDNAIEYIKTEFDLIGEALRDKVKSFLKDNNIPDEDIVDSEIDDAIKTKGYAEEVKEVRPKSKGETKGEKEKGEPVGGMREGDGTEAAQEKVKQRKFDKTIQKAGEVYARMVSEQPMYYTVRPDQVGIDEAVEWLQSRTEEQAQRSLEKRYKDVSLERQERREVFLRHLEDRFNKAVENKNDKEAEEVYDKMMTIRTVLTEEYTRAGRAVRTAAVWARLSDGSVVWSINREIQKANQRLVPGANVEGLKESHGDIRKMSKDFGQAAIEDEVTQSLIDKIANKYKEKPQRTSKEKAKDFAQKIRKIKSSNWGITLAADPISSVGIGVMDGALELTARAVEATGNIAYAIETGLKHIKGSKWYKDLQEKQRRKIARLFAYNIRRDMGVERLSNDELRKYLKEEAKDLGTSLRDLINDHWQNKNELGITLSERIVADLGLSEADAKKLESQIQSVIVEELSSKLTDYVDKADIPKEKEQRQTFINKMGDLIMRGDLETDVFRRAFAESFGLKDNLSTDEANRIMKLHNAVVETSGKGAFADIAADVFAKEIDRLIPESRTGKLLKGMIALDYANVLLGYTTHYVNIISAAANLAMRPIAETTDIIKWINAFKSGKGINKVPTFLSENPMVDSMLAWFYFAETIKGVSANEFASIVKNGDLRAMNKYINQVQSTAHLRVPELERRVYGNDRFSTKIKFKGKELVDIKINPFNFAKISGRLLAAEDAGMFRAFEAVEMAEVLRRKMKKEGRSELEIWQQIQKQVYGKNLTEQEQAEVEKTLAEEEATMKKFGFNIDRFQRERRRLEIIHENFLQLNEEELLDIEKAAKGQVFNDNRGGVVNSIMKRLSNLANKNLTQKLLVTPHFMFFKVMGNIGDFVIDTVPLYGTLRYTGYSPSTMWATYLAYKNDGYNSPDALLKSMFGKRKSVKSLPFLTAQVGDKGTQARERQRQRAMIGNMMILPAVAVVAGLWALGDDDDREPWFDISGARWDIPDRAQREFVTDKMPPYTVKFGKTRFRYQNKPYMMFPLSLLGFYRDMQRAGWSDDKISERMKLMTKAFLYSFSTMTDLNIAGGFKDLAGTMDRLVNTSQKLANDPTAEEISTRNEIKNFGKFLARKQVMPFTSWLPTKNNFVQQMIQLIDEKGRESRDIPAILAYDVGIHWWTNNESIDLFGKPLYKLPGYTQVLYQPLLEKKDPQRWKAFRGLFDNDAIPAPYWNRLEMSIANPMKLKGGDVYDPFSYYEKNLPSENKFYELRKLQGNMFYNDILKYQSSEQWNKDAEHVIGSLKKGDRTRLQDEVSKIWSKSKEQTRNYLFLWKDFESINEPLYKKLYENKALPNAVTSVDIPRLDSNNKPYKDRDGNVVIDTTIDLPQADVAMLNAKAFNSFMGIMPNVLKEMDEFKKKGDIKTIPYEVASKSAWNMAAEIVTKEYIYNYYKAQGVDFSPN